MDVMTVESQDNDKDEEINNDADATHLNAAIANFHVGAESSPELSCKMRFPRSHRHNVDEESGPGPPCLGLGLDDDNDEFVLGNIYDDDDIDDDLAGMMAIHRVDSKDVLFEQKRRKVKVLGKYIMGDKLGDGSYAKVKEAIDSETLCRRAIKIMKRKKLKKIPRGEENVEREIQLISKLNHPNVMRLIEVFYNDEKGKIYMVLEYCCAVLNDMLEQSPVKKFPTWQTHFYFCQLMEGLEYLQSNRIVHKDIKPGNLLLDTAGLLKIADFGVAEKLDLFAPDDMITVSQGTPAFQPPEVANGVERFPGYKVDIWSCGVTLFNFVTGSYPFEGNTIFRLFENIGKGEFKVPRPDIDPVLEGLIRGMLNKNFDERFNVKQVREHDWFRKRYPCNAPPVTVQPRNDDPNLSMSVIPYLQLLHYGEETGSVEVITEHDLRERERRQQVTDDEKQESIENGKLKSKKDKTMKCIKQEGQLCAQHCLNALLQGPFYTAVDLASLAQQLDDEERQQMAEGQGVDSEEYRRFLQQPSGNMDDTGFFSVQVIARAIGVWGLELVSLSSSDPRAVVAKGNPTTQKAFICNFREHWLTIRKLGHQWFNLNSLLTGPELISDTFLGMFLAQLEGEGYTVYIVLGELPACTADQILTLERAYQAEPPKLIGEGAKSSGRRGAGVSRPKPAQREYSEEDEELQRALAMSMSEAGQTSSSSQYGYQGLGGDDDLELAMRLSQSLAQSQATAAAFARPAGVDVTGAHGFEDHSNVVSEEDELQRAIQMSLQSLERPKPAEPTRTPGPSVLTNPKPPVESKPASMVQKPSAMASPSKSPSATKSPQSSVDTRQPSHVTNVSPVQPAPATAPPSRPPASPNQAPMPGIGNRVGGEPEQRVRQATPDPDEVRRRRLAYLEKNKN